MLGLCIAAIGVLILLLQRLNIPMGRLPGDILWKRGNTTVYAPVVTCLLISAVLSLLFWLFGRR